jgi:hypothetical protein
VQGKSTRLSGEICSRSGRSVYGSLIEVLLETARVPQNPKDASTALLTATAEAIEQKSAESIVVPLWDEGTNMNELRRSNEQLRLIDEPGWGRWSLAC